MAKFFMTFLAFVRPLLRAIGIGGRTSRTPSFYETYVAPLRDVERTPQGWWGRFRVELDETYSHTIVTWEFAPEQTMYGRNPLDVEAEPKAHGFEVLPEGAESYPKAVPQGVDLDGEVMTTSPEGFAWSYGPWNQEVPGQPGVWETVWGWDLLPSSKKL